MVRWIVYYLLAFFFEVTVTVFIALHKLPGQITATEAVILISITTLVFLTPAFLIMLSGLRKPERSTRRAIGSGWLMFTNFFTIINLLQTIGLQLLTLYLLNICVSLLLIWYFRLPFALALLAAVFPGIAQVYFLIYGQIRSPDRAFS